MKIAIRRTMTLLASSALLAGAGTEALAQGVDVTQSYCIPAGDMSKLGGFEVADGEVGGTLSINGNAEILADGRMSLTNVSKTGGQTATFYYIDPVNFRYTDEANKITRQFHLFFSFSIGPNQLDTLGGSGLSFLVQNNSNSLTGANADGIGYGGVKKSFQFEFDTRRDIPSAGTANFPDPFDDHIGFMLDGNQAEHPAFFLPKTGALADQFVSTGPDTAFQRWYVWIDYAGGAGADAKVFKLYLSKTKVKPDMPIMWEEHPTHVGVDPAMPSLPSNFDPDYWLSIAAAGQPGQGWVGFSASTYSSLIENSHYIHEFEFSNKGIPCACQVEGNACDKIPGATACSAGPNTQNQGQCVECTVADKDACTGAKPVCHPTDEVCVECNTDAECPTPNAPNCDMATHTCQPCVTDDDCAPYPETPICVNEGTPGASCGECDDNADCKNPALPVCDLTTNTCEECATNADCPADAPVCNPESKTCEPTCTTDEDCKSHPNEPACAMTGDKAGQCVPCTADKHCPENLPVCDVATYTCGGCKTNEDCTSTAPVCDIPKGTCGDCQTDADCARFSETPSCILTGDTAGQCGKTPPPVVEVIEGGGCACAAAGSSSSEGIFAGLLSALGVALAVGRRRRRSS
jgi:MYXO-CTERM domain-containing protein